MMDAPTTSDRTRRTRSPGVELSGSAQAGIALIAVGGVLLADNLGWLDAGALLRDWWPGLVIAAGIAWVLSGARAVGAAAILLGVLLLANVQEVIDADVGSMIFPSIMVLLGVSLLNAAARVRTIHDVAATPPRSATAAPGSAGPGWPSGDLAATAIFGDAQLVVSDGGLDIALDRVTVTALSIFGDVKVDVPAGWRVEDHTSAVFGDVKIPRDQPTYAEAPVVELHGLVLFGDAKVRYLDAPEGGR